MTPTAPQPDRAGDDRQWFIVGRWQAYEGEARANLLRIIGVGAFYGVELVNYHRGVVTRSFHETVTMLALAWAVLGLLILYCLAQYIFPRWLKFLSTAADLALLTGILLVADGPRSPLVVGYFLIIVLATLRFNLPLVWFATAGSLLGYLGLLVYVRWLGAADLQVPRHHQAITVLALALTGIVLGQVIRRVRAMAVDYAARLQAQVQPGETPSAQE